MAIHFGEWDGSMVIQLHTAGRALQILNELEKKMHNAFGYKGKNVHGEMYSKVLNYIRNYEDVDGIVFAEIWKNFSLDLDGDKMMECMKFLIETKQIVLGEELKYKIKK